MKTNTVELSFILLFMVFVIRGQVCTLEITSLNSEFRCTFFLNYIYILFIIVIRYTYDLFINLTHVFIKNTFWEP